MASSAIWLFVVKNWKTILVVLTVVAIAITLWGMSKRIESQNETIDSLNTSVEAFKASLQQIEADIVTIKEANEALIVVDSWTSTEMISNKEVVDEVIKTGDDWAVFERINKLFGYCEDEGYKD